MIRTRGIRNNNPFNIKRSSANWIGKYSSDQFKDDVFETFGTMNYGLRAGIMLLRTYLKMRYTSVNDIISRFAPSSENDTKAYVAFVCDYMKVDPDTEIDNIDYFYLLCAAICRFESRYTFSRSHFDTILHIFNINLKFDF